VVVIFNIYDSVSIIFIAVVLFKRLQGVNLSSNVEQEDVLAGKSVISDCSECNCEPEQ